MLSGATTTTTTATLPVLLHQLVNRTSLYQKLHTVVVVAILSDVDVRLADEFVQLIASEYLYEINIGFIHILQQARSLVVVVVVVVVVAIVVAVVVAAIDVINVEMRI